MDKVGWLAIAGGVGALLALLGKWFNVSKARHEADKAKAEAEKAIAERDKARSDGELAKELAKAEIAKATAELQKATDEVTALRQAEQRRDQAEHIRELADNLLGYADERRRLVGNRNLMFSKQEVETALGVDGMLFDKVMQRLIDTGHAKKTPFANQWDIGDDLPKINPGAF